MDDTRKKLAESSQACLRNGKRLLNDAEFLELDDIPATAHFLCEIAQEEFAKAFLLALVVRGVIPWDRRILSAAQDHRCKQLLCIVMEYLSPDHEEFIDRCNAGVLRREIPKIPAGVVDAINILRHEKLGRWTDQQWVWAEDPEYDRETLAVANGKRDRVKQDSLYVRLASDGGIASTPSGYTTTIVCDEREKAKRLGSLSESVLEGKENPRIDWSDVEEVFRTLFSSLTELD